MEYVNEDPYLLSEGRKQYILNTSGSLLNHFYIKPNEGLLDCDKKNIKQLEQNLAYRIMNDPSNLEQHFDRDTILNAYTSNTHPTSIFSRREGVRLLTFVKQNKLRSNPQINCPQPPNANGKAVSDQLASIITREYCREKQNPLLLLQEE
ncbi:developmentally-regulated protein [Acrasis kona]|uniref:Developmentally-regulated protein n=1 Tax=Acrasis kona TaxID=1008807 RepID=A0AAW2YNM9_9EUKA